MGAQADSCSLLHCLGHIVVVPVTRLAWQRQALRLTVKRGQWRLAMDGNPPSTAFCACNLRCPIPTARFRPPFLLHATAAAEESDAQRGAAPCVAKGRAHRWGGLCTFEPPPRTLYRCLLRSLFSALRTQPNRYLHSFRAPCPETRISAYFAGYCCAEWERGF